MAINEYFTRSRYPEQESHYQIQFSVIPRTSLFEEGVLHPHPLQSAYSKPYQLDTWVENELSDLKCKSLDVKKIVY